MRRVVLIVIPTFVVITYFLYRSLGGGAELQFELVDLPETTIAGEWFEGRAASPDLEKLFFQMRDASSFEDSVLLTVITVPTQKEDTVRQFIGILAEPKDSAEAFTIPSGQYVIAIMDMHTAVRPSPESVAEDASEFAASSGLSLSSERDIQMFTSESEIRVLFRVEE